MSPTTPSICRLAFVSEDNRLIEYVCGLTESAKNVRILSSLDELESLINTLVSEIPEEFAKELTKKASKLFFEKGNENTFYYKQGIRDQIKEQYPNELKKSPVDKLIKSTIGKTWWITEPVFMKKEKARIYWASSVQSEFELYHMEESENDKRTSSLASLLSKSKDTSSKGLINALMSMNAGEKVVDFNGRDVFEVHWSTKLSPAKNLTAPRLEKIIYAGNNLSE